MNILNGNIENIGVNSTIMQVHWKKYATYYRENNYCSMQILNIISPSLWSPASNSISVSVCVWFTAHVTKSFTKFALQFMSPFSWNEFVCISY